MRMLMSEAEAIERPKIVVGQEYTFYAEMQQEYEPREKRLRNYTGCTVIVIGINEGEQEIMEGAGMIYTVRTLDGHEFSAQEEEINGWDRDLGQFFWPDGTYGHDRDRSFLVNERSSA